MIIYHPVLAACPTLSSQLYFAKSTDYDDLDFYLTSYLLSPNVFFNILILNTSAATELDCMSAEKFAWAASVSYYVVVRIIKSFKKNEF